MKKIKSRAEKIKYILLGVFCFIVLVVAYFLLPKNSNPGIVSDILSETKEEIVQGTSMQPLIRDGQKISYKPDYYKNHSVEHSDVIIAKVAAHSGLIIKRIVGIPGDKWTYSGGAITLNGSILKNSAGEPYKINSPMLKLYSESYPVIPNDAFLILGDQIGGTLDASKFGFISSSDITGKVVKY